MHGRGGWAALIERAGTVREVSGSAHDTTHNRMELTAICEALEALTGAVEVRTDSAYVEKCFNQNWHERWLRDGSWKGSNDLRGQWPGRRWVCGSRWRPLRTDRPPERPSRTPCSCDGCAQGEHGDSRGADSLGPSLHRDHQVPPPCREQNRS
jgi:hypothetical protein